MMMPILRKTEIDEEVDGDDADFSKKETDEDDVQGSENDNDSEADEKEVGPAEELIFPPLNST